MSAFPDHFSGVAGAYAGLRPRYPDRLFAWLAEFVDRRELAWDCGTGNGQAAVALADYFERVIGTDASAAALEEEPRCRAQPVPGACELRRVSTPGLRKYVAVAEIPRVRNGLGMAILSTSKGLMTDRQARQARTGGELLAVGW